jgi:hypothetical protein
MKFKYAESEGWYYQIDDLGNQGQSWNAKNRPQLEKDRLAWLEAGNEMLPRYSDEEIAQQEIEKAEQALESQRQKCQALLDKSDKRMVSDWPYPADKAQNETYRAALRACMSSEEIQDIPTDPFSQ